MIPAAAIVLTSIGLTSLFSDPSLKVEQGAPSHTRCSLGSVVLDHQGINLTWDGDDFALSLNGASVGDLTTFTNGNGDLAFQGGYTAPGYAPTVFGSVIEYSSTEWDVVITRPSHKPSIFSVESSGTVLVISHQQECDCSDRVTLTCTTALCNSAGTCATSYECKWYTVSN